MKISVIGTTKPGYVATKEELEDFSGKSAGVCYMPHSFEELLNEEKIKTEKRIFQTKISKHHSVYSHPYVCLYLENIPKALAMVLNNEKMYTTSEKSARYTKMVLQDKEQKLYDKWLEIFKELIKTEYQEKNPKFFTDGKIEKLAQENARYLISVFTPTSMIYTTSYGQLNYIYGFLKTEINRSIQNKFYETLKPAMIDLCEALEKTGYIDSILQDNGKNRTLSLYNKSIVTPYFGDVYATSYKGSFAQLAQAQRHRTIDYTMCLLNNNEFYVPPIIEKSNALTQEWIRDCNKQSSIFPQGMLININEFGTLDNFILKMLERLCAMAQLEINQQTSSTRNKYLSALKEINHTRTQELEKFNHSRCLAGYKCSSFCGFKEGITGERII
ncbi:MAG: FAD-dependent thymidylate synthase [Clostridia bacterium]|nr:FAD-dependent thymidylate synthase [Clostridia bacterium]